MRLVPALMMLFGALAVLLTAAGPARALAEAAPPPCHEAGPDHSDVDTRSPGSGAAMEATDCCVGWVVGPALRSPERARLIPPRPATVAPPAAMPAGLQPVPEPYPPRTLPF